jgi:hypothetical protein
MSLVTANEKLITPPNDPLGHRQLLKLLEDCRFERIWMEATGTPKNAREDTQQQEVRSLRRQPETDS